MRRYFLIKNVFSTREVTINEIVSKMLRENNDQSRILYPIKPSCKIKNKNKRFLWSKDWVSLIPSRPLLKEFLKMDFNRRKIKSRRKEWNSKNTEVGMLVYLHNYRL